MHFSFVFTVFFLLLASIVRDERVSVADDICNAYLTLHSTIFINNSTRISFSKTPALTLSCLGLCTQNTLYKKCGHNPSLQLSLLLLLSGDVSLNPGPNISCNMRFATTNLRSLRQKSAALADLISSKQIDILAMTETWLSSCDTAACLAEISPPGFSLFHCSRPSGRGGGVALLVRESFKVEIIHTPTFLRFEAICILVKHSSMTANFICIYRPPGCTTMFFDEFQNFLENTLHFQDELYIFGDFNIHLDKPSVNTRSFLDILDTFSLHQHVTFPTHINGHWLDLFITISNCENVKVVTSSDGLSDHLTVLIDVWLQIKSSPEKANITFPPIHKIDLDSLHMDLSNSDILMYPKTSLLELTDQFSKTLSQLLDKHAPRQTKMTKLRPPSPWMSLEIIIAKRRRRNLERVWRRSRSALDRSRYTKQLHLCNRMMSKSKSDYYTSLLSNNSANPRQMRNSVNKILHREKSKPLPEHTSLDTLCSSFSKFFTDKITLIRSNFVTNDHSHNFPKTPHVENVMNQSTPTTTSEVRSIIIKSTNASCDLDPFPTRLLKHYIDDLIIPITAIINLSMQDGVVPHDFKQALVTPLIKKKTLCRNEFKNYRPISNLSFPSKILERVVTKRLNAHIEEQLLLNQVQSAYKRFHSTETALLKIHNDIICNMDNGKVTALTLLDTSKEPVCPRVELIFKIIIILLIIFLGFIKSKPC